MFLRECRTCKVKKPYREFPKDQYDKRKGLFFRSYQCKKCKNQITKESRYGETASRENLIKGKILQSKTNARKRGYKACLTPWHMIIGTYTETCMICGKFCGRDIYLDHCHNTGVHRGWICGGCNRSIAIFDNKELLLKALAYLKLTIALQERTTHAIY